VREAALGGEGEELEAALPPLRRGVLLERELPEEPGGVAVAEAGRFLPEAHRLLLVVAEPSVPLLVLDREEAGRAELRRLRRRPDCLPPAQLGLHGLEAGRGWRCGGRLPAEGEEGLERAERAGPVQGESARIRLGEVLCGRVAAAEELAEVVACLRVAPAQAPAEPRDGRPRVGRDSLAEAEEVAEPRLGLRDAGLRRAPHPGAGGRKVPRAEVPEVERIREVELRAGVSRRGPGPQLLERRRRLRRLVRRRHRRPPAPKLGPDHGQLESTAGRAAHCGDNRSA
jgi:hypothetical protein